MNKWNEKCNALSGEVLQAALRGTSDIFEERDCPAHPGDEDIADMLESVALTFAESFPNVGTVTKCSFCIVFKLGRQLGYDEGRLAGQMADLVNGIEDE